MTERAHYFGGDLLPWYWGEPWHGRALDWYFGGGFDGV